ncbi:MAG: DUF4919 domain-containing protein [Planctomycetes bacterium]|nr:DUF4919 domain-containing protein [Planctomycetota bacterium]
MADDPFFTFLKDPNRDNFIAIRDVVRNHSSYAPYGQELNAAEKLLEGEDWNGFIDKGRELIPNYLLSPRFHLMRSFALKQIGDEESADMEAAMCMVCIEGIRSTGDGTEDAPWLVLRTLDEYDVLEQMGKSLKKQALVHKEGRALDRMECEDGEVVWFDVTDAFKKLNEEMGEGKSGQ